MRRGLLTLLRLLIPPALIIVILTISSHGSASTGLHTFTFTDSDFSVELSGSRRRLKISRSLAARTPWQQDEECRQFNISYLEPR